MSTMPDRSAIALKEWAVVCEGLGAGRSVLLLRKGGISERSTRGGEEGQRERGFAARHRELFLFPTYFHEKADDLVPWARERVGEIAPPPAGTVALSLFARVAVAEDVHDR